MQTCESCPHNCAATTGCKETPDNYFTFSKFVFALHGAQARIYGRRRKLLLSNSVERRIRNRRWGNGGRVVRALARHHCEWGFESRSCRNFVKFLPSYVLWMGSPALVRGFLQQWSFLPSLFKIEKVVVVIQLGLARPADGGSRTSRSHPSEDQPACVETLCIVVVHCDCKK